MTDGSNAGEQRSQVDGRSDPRFHLPFDPPFWPPESWPLSTTSHRPFIEAQRSLLVWYRDQLERRAGADSFDDRLRAAMNAFMASWLDAVHLWREQRDQTLRLQSELINRYLDVLDQILDRTDDKGP